MNVDDLNKLCTDSMISHLGIRFLESESPYQVAKMPVNEKTRQPHGFLHGGAMISLAETVASASSATLAPEYASFGYHVDASLLKAVRDGFVYGIPSLVHRGRSTHIWDVRIEDADEHLLALCRVTVKLIRAES